jgi:transcriptional regulator with XRE-family HTH domain
MLYGGMSTFGQNVRRLMRERHLEPSDLTSTLGVKQGTLSDWMRDRRGVPEGPTLLKFGKALGVTVDELISGVDSDYDRVARIRTSELLEKLTGIKANIRAIEQRIAEADNIPKDTLQALLLVLAPYATNMHDGEPEGTLLQLDDKDRKNPLRSDERPRGGDEHGAGATLSDDTVAALSDKIDHLTQAISALGSIRRFLAEARGLQKWLSHQAAAFGAATPDQQRAMVPILESRKPRHARGHQRADSRTAGKNRR